MNEGLCRFCAIDPNRTHIIKQFTHCYICLSNPRLMKGHLLIIPYRHVEKLSQLSKDERQEILDVTIKYQEKILKKHWGCDIKQNCRPQLPENYLSVHHIHIHLLPRKFNDELYKKVQMKQQDVFKEVTKKEVEEIKKILT